MDYAKALTFITDDHRWQTKIAIGTGVMIASTALSFVLVGILGFFIVIGYCIRLLQNVQAGQSEPLPEWDAWGEDLVRGLKYAVVGIVWALPLILFSIPLTFGAIMADSGGDFGEFMGVSILVCGSCLMLIYGIVFFLASPGFTIAFSQDEQIMSGLQVSKIWQWTQANLGPVILVAFAYLAVSLILGALGTIVGALLCGVGLLITVPLASLVTYIYEFHLFGQLAWQSPFDGDGPTTGDRMPDGDGDSESSGAAPLIAPSLTDESPAEMPVDEVPVAEALVDEALVAEALVDEALVDEAPVDEVPADDIPPSDADASQEGEDESGARPPTA